MTGRTLDLRARCARQRCNKLPRGTRQQADYKRYAPYCCFHCKECDRVESSLRMLAAGSTSHG